jgi:hypothetical protein
MGRIRRSCVGERCAAATASAEPGNSGQLGERPVGAAASAAGQIGRRVVRRAGPIGRNRRGIRFAFDRAGGSGEAASSERIGWFHPPGHPAFLELAGPGAAAARSAAGGEWLKRCREDRLGRGTAQRRVAPGPGSGAAASCR